MSQTTYPSGIVKGESGDVATLDSGNIVSKFLATGEPDVSYGRAVETDASNGDSNVTLYAGGKLAGVALRDKAKTDDDLEGHVGPTELSVMPSGYVWVEVDSDVATDDDVYVRQSAEPEVFTITWDADFVASNVVNGSIAGTAISAVPFNTDHATTLQDVADEIALLTSLVASATVTGAREITVTGANDGEDLSSTGTSFTVTLGASQGVDTIANVTGPSDGTELGIFRSDDDDVGSGANAVQITRAKFITSAVSGEVAMLQINLP